MRHFIFGLAIASVASAAACSSFSSTDAPAQAVADADAGADGGKRDLTGTPSATLDIGLPDGPAMLPHGTSLRLKVTVVRGGGFEGAVQFNIRNAPDGITAKPLQLPFGITEGELEIDIDAKVPQGTVTGMTIEASNSGVGLLAARPFPAFVRGRAGEIDSTYGTDGVVAGLPQLPLIAQGTHAGEVLYLPTINYLPGSVTTSAKTDSSGNPVQEFPTTLSFLYDAVAYGAGYAYRCHFDSPTSTSTSTSAERYDFETGSKDITFHPVGVISTGTTIGQPNVASCGVLDDGTVAAVVSYQAANASALGWFVDWLRPDGQIKRTALPAGYTPNATLASGNALTIRATVSGNAVIMRYLEETRALDTFYDGDGMVGNLPPSVALGQFDSNNRLLLGYPGGVIRVGVNGERDPSFVAATGVTENRHVFVFARDDGGVVHVSVADYSKSFAITRFTASGAIDVGFADSGTVSVSSGNGTLTAATILPDGRLLAIIDNILSASLMRIWL